MVKIMEKIITVGKSGDLIIPPEIKKSLDIQKDDKFFIFKNKDSIIIRKIQRPSLSKRFENLSKIVANKFKEIGVSEIDVAEAIQWARK
jgi:bifunctional DNA-binding transcriptional regulator/antitoxin component of YhaV-PrlF toxin-antitoxin module